MEPTNKWAGVSAAVGYDTNNNLIAVTRDGTLMEKREYDGANRVLRSGSSGLATGYFNALYGNNVAGTGSENVLNSFRQPIGIK